MAKGLNNPAMAAPKQLRIVLIIVFLTVPATVCGVLAWFVFSHTWADHVADEVSENLPGRVSFGDLQLAGPGAYVVSELSYQDADLLFTSAHAEYGPATDALGFGRKIVCTDNTLSMSDTKDINGLMKLLNTRVQFTAEAIQWKQMSGDLRIDPEQEKAASVPMPSIIIDADGKTTIDDLRIVAPALPQIPAWIHGTDIHIEAFSLAATQGIAGTEGLTWQGSLSFAYLAAQCQLKWTQSSSKQLCSVESFSDPRLPHLRIEDNILYVFGQQWWTKVNIVCAESDWILVGFDADKVLRSLRLSFTEHAINCHFENIQTIDVKDYFDHLVDLPEFLEDYAMTDVDVSGSSFLWTENAAVTGALRVQWKENSLQAVYTSDFTALSAATIKTPEFTISGELSCRDQKMYWRDSQLELMQDSQWSTFLQGERHVEISASDLLVESEGIAMLRMSSPQHWKFTAILLAAEFVNPLCGKNIFAAGTLHQLEISHDADAVTCKAQGTHVSVLWPIAGWAAVDAGVYYLRDSEVEFLELQLTQSLWSAYRSEDFVTIHTWPSIFQFPGPFLTVPLSELNAQP